MLAWWQLWLHKISVDSTLIQLYPISYMSGDPHLLCVMRIAGAGAQIALTTNLSRWMLVPSSMVNLDGSSCNMVGSGYTAFANQAVCHTALFFIVF